MNQTSYFLNKKVFIIAEAGSNWKRGSFEDDLKAAKTMIEAAKTAGADAVKFQTFKSAGEIYVANAGRADYLKSAGQSQSINQILDSLLMPDQFIKELADYCQEKDILFMATPFSLTSARALAPFVQAQKIASYEISHPDLIKFAAQTKKPLILSTGAASLEDIKWAVELFYQSGGERLALMHCTAKYPASLDSLNLRALQQLKDVFKAPVGLSDHSREPLIGPIAAVALGADIIEKHFTLDNNLPGPDHSFALLPQELKAMVKAVRQTELALGSNKKEVSGVEKELKRFAQRAVQAVREIKKGEVLKRGVNIDILRPGKQKQGLHPRFLKEIEGKRAGRNIALGSGITKEDLWQN